MPTRGGLPGGQFFSSGNLRSGVVSVRLCQPFGKRIRLQHVNCCGVLIPPENFAGSDIHQIVSEDETRRHSVRRGGKDWMKRTNQWGTEYICMIHFSSFFLFSSPCLTRDPEITTNVWYIKYWRGEHPRLYALWYTGRFSTRCQAFSPTMHIKEPRTLAKKGIRTGVGVYLFNLTNYYNYLTTALSLHDKTIHSNN